MNYNKHIQRKQNSTTGHRQTKINTKILFKWTVFDVLFASFLCFLPLWLTIFSFIKYISLTALLCQFHFSLISNLYITLIFTWLGTWMIMIKTIKCIVGMKIWTILNWFFFIFSPTFYYLFANIYFVDSVKK